MKIIYASYLEDKDSIIKHSKDLGYLTGEENQYMVNAQIGGALAVAEPFRYKDGPLFDFGQYSVK